MLVLVVLATQVPRALGHSLQGDYTFSAGCQIEWLSFEVWPGFYTWTDEVSGCGDVRVRQRVHVYGYWITRQATHHNYANLTSTDQSDECYSDHQAQDGGTWKGLTKKFHNGYGSPSEC